MEEESFETDEEVSGLEASVVQIVLNEGDTLSAPEGYAIPLYATSDLDEASAM